VKSSSPVNSIVIALYRNDYRRSNCDTADGSTCVIVNCISVRASGINSLYPERREVICRVIHPTRDNIFFNPVDCCFLYKAKDLSAHSRRPIAMQRPGKHIPAGANAQQ
jgi:hypothetical protein